MDVDLTFALCLLLPLSAFVISFFCSMVGVSGAFLLLPVQILLLGTTAPSISATNQLFNCIATPAGVVRYIREGRMVWPLALVVSLGSLSGLGLGIWLRVSWLPDPKPFTLFVCAVLAIMAANLLRSARKEARSAASGKKPAGPASFRVQDIRFEGHVLHYAFNGAICAVSVPALFGVSLLVGIVGGAYGIGGGAIMSPFLVSCFRLPVHSVSAATLFSTLTTALASMVIFSGLGHLYPQLALSPNWAVGLLLGAGGLVGMSLGARQQRKLSAVLLKRLLVVLVLAACLALLARVL